jgi:hypothetical protein
LHHAVDGDLLEDGVGGRQGGGEEATEESEGLHGCRYAGGGVTKGGGGRGGSFYITLTLLDMLAGGVFD